MRWLAVYYRIQRIQVVLNSCHHGSSVGFYFAVEQGFKDFQVGRNNHNSNNTYYCYMEVRGKPKLISARFMSRLVYVDQTDRHKNDTQIPITVESIFSWDKHGVTGMW